MDLNDALQRVVLRRLPLIGACVLIAVLAAVLTSMGRGGHEYASSTRVAVAAQAARSSQEAVAQSAQVEAVATSRSVVARAMRSAGLHGSPGRIAEHGVTVSGLGTSPVAKLTVKASDPETARALARAIAAEVVAVLDQPRAALERLHSALEAQMSSLRAQREKMVAGLPIVTSPRDTATVAGIDEQLLSLGDRLAGVETQLGLTFTPQVVDAAGPAQPQPSSLLVDAALAAVLGLVLGLGISAIRESLHPTVVGLEALSSIFSAPALGTVDRRDGVRLGLSVDRLATRVDVAARRVDTNVVALAGPLPESQLSDLAQNLDYLLAGHAISLGSDGPPQSRLEARLRISMREKAANGHGVGDGSTIVESPVEPGRESVRVLPCDDRTLSLLGRSHDQRMGVLVVAPRCTPRDGLLHVADVVDTTGWPLIGVITVAEKKRASRLLGAWKNMTKGLQS